MFPLVQSPVLTGIHSRKFFKIAQQFPKLFDSDHVPNTLRTPLSSFDETRDGRKLERAIVLLSYVGHEFVWGAARSVTVRRTSVNAAKSVHNNSSAQKMNAAQNGHELNATALVEAIEIHTEAIAKLLRSCGSSQQFGLEHQHQYERLMKRRRRLISKLEGLTG